MTFRFMKHTFLLLFYLSWQSIMFQPLKAQLSMPFLFSLKNTASTSAGVFSKDGTLIRTLWSGMSYSAGNHRSSWDGMQDDGTPAPAAGYDVRVLSGNVQYHWDGVIGNTSILACGLLVRNFAWLGDPSL